jgi:hypothetical protein
MMEAAAPVTPHRDQRTYVLVGGAAGASKSHGARFGAYWWALTVPKCRILLLREVSDELKRSHILGLMDTEAPALGASFVTNPVPLARWPNGSFIEGGHMEDAASVKRYLSSEYDLIIAEEGSLYDPSALMELTTRARTTNEAMLARGGARVWIPTNPGGPSTPILRQLFLDRDLSVEEWPALALTYRPEEWIHVPGRLEDNPYLDQSYERGLAVLRQAWRYQQLRHGDWYAQPGQFFDAFSPTTHVREIDLGAHPEKLSWFRSLDWGYHDPMAMLWWVVLDDGHLHVAAELKGRLQTPKEVTPKLRAIDDELKLPKPRDRVITWASPDMWANRGQLGEFLQETARKNGWPVRPAKTDRINGWMRIQELLRPAPDGSPWLTIHPRCKNLIRSLQTAQCKEDDPDDVRQLDDHFLESLRYGAMSRPAPAYRPPESPQTRLFAEDFAPKGKVAVGAGQWLK